MLSAVRPLTAVPFCENVGVGNGEDDRCSVSSLSVGWSSKRLRVSKGRMKTQGCAGLSCRRNWPRRTAGTSLYARC